MIVDYGSVLVAVGAAGTALCFTLFSNWLKQRESGYLAAWSIAMAVIIAAVVTFAIYGAGGHRYFGLSAGILLIWAFSISLGATTQFALGRFPSKRTIWLALAMNAAVVPPYILGFDGLAFIFINLFSAMLIAVSGVILLRLRAESAAAITTLAVLHMLLAASFALCVVPIVLENPLVLDGPPDNWAELANLIACVIGITGIGGLLVTVHQERIARAYRQAANTDALTGVLNRRAVGNAFPDGMVPPHTAMIVFDLDDFKGINDRHGHSFGDRVLLCFAGLMAGTVVEPGLCARIGGEEFAVILPRTGIQQARALAEMVRLRFACQRFRLETGTAACTVSAGISGSGPDGCTLDQLLQQADAALYVSKRDGRNRVTTNAAPRQAA